MLNAQQKERVSPKQIARAHVTSLLLNNFNKLQNMKTPSSWKHHLSDNRESKMTATTQFVAGDSQVLKALSHCQAQGQAESRQHGLLAPDQPCSPELLLCPQVLKIIISCPELILATGWDNIIQGNFGKTFDLGSPILLTVLLVFSRCRETR